MPCPMMRLWWPEMINPITFSFITLIKKVGAFKTTIFQQLSLQTTSGKALSIYTLIQEKLTIIPPFSHFLKSWFWRREASEFTN